MKIKKLLVLEAILSFLIKKKRVTHQNLFEHFLQKMPSTSACPKMARTEILSGHLGNVILPKKHYALYAFEGEPEDDWFVSFHQSLHSEKCLEKWQIFG